jgi:hypothetical protein
LAITASSPSLTFEGRLIEFIEEHFGNDPARGVATASPWTPEAIAADKYLNPESRSLSASDIDVLASLLAGINSRKADLERQERSLCKDALAKAVAQSNYLTKGWPSGLNANTPEGLRALQNRMAERKKEAAEQSRLLAERLGKPMRDWASSSLNFTHNDGMSYVTTVYFTPHDAPELFACRQRLADTVVEMRASVKRFFKELRR